MGKKWRRGSRTGAPKRTSTLRKLLERGEVALPPSERESITRELLATTWTVTGTGKVLIEAKADIKVKLGGRSPDVADALVMALAPTGVVNITSSTGAVPIA